MVRGREVGAWAVLVVFGMVLAGGMLEVGVRVLHLVPDRFWEPDPALGTRHIPGERGWWTQEEHEFVVPISISEQGLRDVSHEYAKPPGVRRIMLIGDSFIEALQVPLEQTVARQLAAAVPADEVINAGVSGYGTASELLFLRGEGRRFDADVVVLFVYPGNDVKNNSPSLEDVLPPQYDDTGALVRVTATRESVRRGWSDHSKAYQLLRQTLLRHPELLDPLRRLGLVTATGPRVAAERGGVPVDYWVFAPEPDAEWAAAWKHTLDLLQQVRQTTEAAGARLVVVVVPSRYEIYPEWWDETVATHPGMHAKPWDVSAPGRRVLAWCAAQAVPCLDVAAGLQHAAATEPPLYFHADGHWTATGHALVAQQLAAFLRAHQLVTTH